MTCGDSVSAVWILPTAFAYLGTAEFDKNHRKRKFPGMGDFEKVGENLVRHENGVYYLRAKVAGKTIRVSLKTDVMKIAKIKRNARLSSERSQAAAAKGTSKTLRDAVNALEADMVNRPNIRPKTAAACGDLIRILRDTLPLSAAGGDWSRQEAAAWWQKIGAKYSVSVANKLHGVIRKLAGILIEHGLRVDDPTRELQRMRPRKVLRAMPGRADMDRILAFIRGQRKRGCLQSSRLVGFLAFSGCRKGEAAALVWKHVKPDWLEVGTDGETKGAEFRRVPISGPLRVILEDARPEDAQDADRIFSLKSPRRALDTACEALELPRMRVHDLRHFYATWCIESGVDIPTVSKWLGHKDGGALAMRTYGHVRDDHSLAAVAKLV